MAENTVPPFGINDLLGMLGGANPLSGVTKSVQQFQRGVNEFLTAVEQFNATMAQLNLVAARVNRLLDDVEPAARALLPQITRTIETTESMVGQLGSLAALPRDVGEVVDVLRDLARRLQPLGQVAESAGGLFGLVTRAGGFLSPTSTASTGESTQSSTGTEASKPEPTVARPVTKRNAKKPAEKSTTTRATSTAKASPTKRSPSGTRSTTRPSTSRRT